MDTIQFKPAGIILSSALDDISIATTNPHVDVTLSVPGLTILQERYFPHNGLVTLQDFASLMEQHLRILEVPLARFTLQAGSDSHTFQILYCDRFQVCQDPDSFLRSNFLSTLEFRRIPPHIDQSLNYLAFKDETTHAVAYSAIRTDDGAIQHFAMSITPDATATKTDVINLTISMETILYEARRRFGGNPQLLSIQVNVGDRQATFFIDPALTNADTFFFRNCFNTFEAAYLPAVTTAKTTVERETAIVNGNAHFYDQSATKTYEVKATALTPYEADWIDQLITSYSVFRAIASDTDALFLPVIITDATCEAHNANDTLNDIKFTWRYASNRPIASLPDATRFFTSQFVPTFA